MGLWSQPLHKVNHQTGDVCFLELVFVTSVTSVKLDAWRNSANNKNRDVLDEDMAQSLVLAQKVSVLLLNEL